MTIYLYSSINDGESLMFDPLSDVLNFDLNTISAANLLLTQSGLDLMITAEDKTFTLLNVSLGQLSTFNVTFADGSVLLVGDHFPGPGDDFNNSLNGGVGDDHLIGLGGDDFLNGGGGIDRLVGGTGNDFYILDSAADLIIEAGDQGTDTVAVRFSYVLPDNFENLLLEGSGAIAGTGNELDNVIIGSLFEDNVLDGLGGNDRLRRGPRERYDIRR